MPHAWLPCFLALSHTRQKAFLTCSHHNTHITSHTTHHTSHHKTHITSHTSPYTTHHPHRDVKTITSWLEAQSADFNCQYGVKPDGVDASEFLTNAALHGQQLYNGAAVELIRLVNAQCVDLGHLTGDIWQGFGSMVWWVWMGVWVWVGGWVWMGGWVWASHVHAQSVVLNSNTNTRILHTIYVYMCIHPLHCIHTLYTRTISVYTLVYCTGG